MSNSLKEFFKHLDIDITQFPDDTIVIGNDLAMVSFNGREHKHHEPQKFEHASIMICTKGELRLKINLEEYTATAPTLITLMPGQITEYIESSGDLQLYDIALSKRFIDMINIPGWQQQYLEMYNNPLHPLDEQALRAIHIFYSILYHAAANTDNPFRLQVIENLIRVFYYGGISNLRPTNESMPSAKNSIVRRFMELVQEHYREERLIGFYADKLCITPKYLSKLVKENTGRSAGDWIENHVILEARAMLQSSDMTIQQIATSLNFPNQSFFGKYFKRATGLSPKQYRNNRTH